MSYCVNCGVKLGESEQSCPLCQTKVYHPESPPDPNAPAPFPSGQPAKRKMKPKYGHLIATLLTILPALLSVIIDYSINRSLVWSGFVLGGVALLYCFVFVPLFVSRRSIFYYLGLDAIACALYLNYLAQATNGAWFLPFALPVTASLTAMLSVILLLKKLRHLPDLLLTAVAFFLTGAECVFVEVMVNHAFLHTTQLVWSHFPLITFAVLGGFLLLLHKNQRLRHKFEKFFFI